MQAQENTINADTINIDFKLPEGWHQLNDEQLLYLFSLMAAELSFTEIAATCLLRWSGTEVIGQQPGSPYFLVKQGKQLFDLRSIDLAQMLQEYDWLATVPQVPIRLSRIRRYKALPADFQSVPFEQYIICDNLYQGYLQTQNDTLLDELAVVLYPGLKLHHKGLDPAQRISIFYWMASLKAYFSHRFSDFLQPTSQDNLLGTSTPDAKTLQESMDAQIRALTKGDITKESEILALDTWRALTELNAQAREYRELKGKL